ncbi:hypothetical protein HELRODRAFT_62181, partial [Helobdella robusta]|uniref:GPR180-like N-terminal domain-containing protein n=1 Tax=Helobdella robusta TaxID=6412 RepID=T1FWW6_HELRO
MNVSVKLTGQLTFELVYPANKCCLNILFYTDEQTNMMNERMDCWQRENILKPEEDQILRLTPSFPWSGC